MSVIIGIDGGFANIGWGIWDSSADGAQACGVIRSQVEKVGVTKGGVTRKVRANSVFDDEINRLQDSLAEFRQLLQVRQPKLAVIETLSMSNNAVTVRKLALMYGGLIATLNSAGVSWVHVRPQDLHVLITGSPKATKEQMRDGLAAKMEPGKLKALLAASNVAKATTLHEHAVDALALAYASTTGGSSDGGVLLHL